MVHIHVYTLQVCLWQGLLTNNNNPGVRNLHFFDPTELKNDCACVTGDPAGQSRSRLPSRRDIWRENIDLNNTFRMKEPRVS